MLFESFAFIPYVSVFDRYHKLHFLICDEEWEKLKHGEPLEW